MKRILMSLVVFAAVGGATLTVTASSAEARCRVPNCWGAIAIGTNNGRWAYVYNYSNRSTARRLALRRCRGACNRVLTFRNSCAAYAVAGNGVWGWGGGFRSRGAAQRRALRECRIRRGRGCRIRVWSCTSR